MNFKMAFLGLVLAGGAAVAVGSHSRAGTVEGTVTYLERIALPPGARLEVELRDVSLADAPAKTIAAESYDLNAVPAEYALNFRDSDIEARHRYAVAARITLDGELLFINDTAYPVLTQGAPERADLVVKRVSKGPEMAAEALLDDTEWKLVALNGVAITDGKEPGLAFGAAGAFSASSGCNSYRGDADVEGNAITFPDRMAGTLKACVPGLDVQERDFLLALEQARSFEREGPLLRLMAEDGTVLMELQKKN